MYSIKTILMSICSAAVLLLLPGCDEGAPIDKKTMSDIVADMYLADQYVERTPSLMVQVDSMRLYAAIMDKYGFTVEDYNSSMRYYLQEGHSYGDILRSAYSRLEKREKELDAITQSEEAALRKTRLERWWAIDSLNTVDPSELLHDRLLRSVKWLVMPQKRLQQWTILDSAVVDIPQNPQWWANTACPPERAFHTFMVNKETTDDKNEKDSGKLRLPDNRKPNKERLRKVQ
ncbi:MAG: DUF4296 domain-containing protein [Bacteroidales bacterium]|nr:DUF4296 domain-containing protein [Bacteroidales bacterium]